MIEIMYYLLAVQDSGEVADGAISKSCCPGYNRAKLGLLLSSNSHFGVNPKPAPVFRVFEGLGCKFVTQFIPSFLQGR